MGICWSSEPDFRVPNNSRHLKSRSQHLNGQCYSLRLGETEVGALLHICWGPLG